MIAQIYLYIFAAQDALNIMHPLLKVCPLSQASPQSKAKARRCTGRYLIVAILIFHKPYHRKPEQGPIVQNIDLR